MHLTLQQFLGLDESRLRDFLAIGINEGTAIDYKTHLTDEKWNRESKKECLKDITAFANAYGGHIFIGVKEPKKATGVDDQVVGIDDSDDLAKRIEMLCTSSIEPRIPGLHVRAVAMSNGRGCVIVHIPGSLRRPHMVNHDGHRAFYVRHTESSDPMSTHEVREAVLSTATAEDRALRLVDSRIAEVHLGNPSKAFLFVQAAPLMTPQEPWDVKDKEFQSCLSRRGKDRRDPYENKTHLVSQEAPRPTIRGVKNHFSHLDNAYVIDAFRTGYLSLQYVNLYFDMQERRQAVLIATDLCEVFSSFLELLADLTKISEGAIPYLVSCSLINASDALFSFSGSRQQTEQRRWPDQYLHWPNHILEPGQDPKSVADELRQELYNAFGYWAPET